MLLVLVTDPSIYSASRSVSPVDSEHDDTGS